MTYETPALPIEYNELEPVITEEMMHVHYDKHHKGYTAKLNAALEGKDDLLAKTPEELITNPEALPEDVRQKVINVGGGHVNHDFFWHCLKKDIPAEGPAVDAIKEKWGSLEDFQKEFSDKAAALFGSGWTWLVKNAEGKLEIVNTANQDNPLADGKTPLLTLDVWEHAYYLKYMQDRPGFIKAFWQIVNWEFVNQCFEG